MINTLSKFNTIKGTNIAPQCPIIRDKANFCRLIGCESLTSKTPDNLSRLTPSKDINNAPKVAPHIVAAVDAKSMSYAESKP